jgi:hypothetical protein
VRGVKPEFEKITYYNIKSKLVGQPAYLRGGFVQVPCVGCSVVAFFVRIQVQISISEIQLYYASQRKKCTLGERSSIKT